MCAEGRDIIWILFSSDFIGLRIQTGSNLVWFKIVILNHELQDKPRALK